MPLFDIQLVGAKVANVPVVVQLIGPPTTRTAHSVDGELLQTLVRERTDDTGLLTVELPYTDALTPAGCYYRVIAGNQERSTWLVAPTSTNTPGDGPYAIGDTAIQVVSPVPPEWEPVALDVTADLVDPIIAQYLIDNPVTAEPVGALLIANNGSDIDDPEEFRGHIGAASVTVIDDLDTERARVDALEALENTNPAVRVTDGPVVHTQVSPSATWVISHGYQPVPVVTIVDSAGEVVMGEEDHSVPGEVTVRFSGAFSGTAYLVGFPAA